MHSTLFLQEQGVNAEEGGRRRGEGHSTLLAHEPGVNVVEGVEKRAMTKEKIAEMV